MAEASFRCLQCKRTFRMAAHLARHRKAIHGVGAGKRKAKKKGLRGKKRGRRPIAAASNGRRRASARMVTGGPRATARILRDMQTVHRDLLAQRSALDTQIEAIAGAMQALGDNAAPRTATRRRRKKKVRSAKRTTRRGSLKDFIVRVLSQRAKPMSPHEIGAGVVRSGFKTKAKDITKAVSNTLPSVQNVKRVGFGRYQLVNR